MSLDGSPKSKHLLAIARNCFFLHWFSFGIVEEVTNLRPPYFVHSIPVYIALIVPTEI